MNNTITIVTPSLNQGKYLEETIQSVLSQEGDFFIDYIIADGGSTDSSVEIIKKYDSLIKNKKYPIRCKGISFRCWSRPDRGQSDAINQGLKVAWGSIFAWINSDDFYEPGAFGFILEEFKKNPDVDLIYGDGYIINEQTREKIKTKAKPGDFETLLKRGNCVFQPAAFFTKRITDKIGFVDENLHYAMDYDLWLRIMQNSKALHFPKCLSNFRVWEYSKTKTQQKMFRAERKKILKKYGGSIIDATTIYELFEKVPVHKYTRKKFPRFHRILKRGCFLVTDRFCYKGECSK